MAVTTPPEWMWGGPGVSSVQGGPLPFSPLIGFRFSTCLRLTGMICFRYSYAEKTAGLDSGRVGEGGKGKAEKDGGGYEEQAKGGLGEEA